MLFRAVLPHIYLLFSGAYNILYQSPHCFSFPSSYLWTADKASASQSTLKYFQLVFDSYGQDFRVVGSDIYLDMYVHFTVTLKHFGCGWSDPEMNEHQWLLLSSFCNAKY